MEEELFSALFDNYNQRSHPYFKSDSNWTSQLMKENRNFTPIKFSVRKRCKEFAETLYQDEVSAFKKNSNLKQNDRNSPSIYKAVAQHGTTKDKIAALSLSCVRNPVHSISELFSLVDCANQMTKNYNHNALNNINKVFHTTYLVKNSVATEFEAHDFSLLVPILRKRSFEQVQKQFILWYLQDQILAAYLKLIVNLDKLCHVTQSQLRKRGLKSLESLLLQNSKQCPDVIIEKLVNKFGDTNKKICGDVVQVLNIVQLKITDLKFIIVNNVEQLLYRNNVTSKAQYYCLCFMKDVLFTKNDSQLPERLIQIYFHFFESCVKKGEVESRFMSSILRGIKRALPYTDKRSGQFIEEKKNMLYKLTHLSKFGVATQVIQLLYSFEEISRSDRFYKLLYDQLLHDEFTTSSSNGAFLNVIFKAMANDSSADRFRAFIRRLLQVALQASSRVAVAILFLISEAVKDNSCEQGLSSILCTTNAAETDNKKYKKVEHVDLRVENIKSTVENEKKLAGSYTLCNENDISADCDSDYEYYPDLDVEDDNIFSVGNESRLSGNNENSSDMKSPKGQINTRSPEISKVKKKGIKDNLKEIEDNKKDLKFETSWMHRNNLNPKITKIKTENNQKLHSNKQNYDPSFWNPIFCGADLEPCWELEHVQNHFHPTVSLFANTLLEGSHVKYTGDPLEDFTLRRFMDRFVYRNPKKVDEAREKSGKVYGCKDVYQPFGNRSMSTSSDKFKKLQQKDVAPEDLFVHRYLTKYRKSIHKQGPKNVKKQDMSSKEQDMSSEEQDMSSDDDDDDEFDHYLKKLPTFKDLDEPMEHFDDLDFTKFSKTDFGMEEENSDFEEKSDDDSDFEEENGESDSDFGEESEEKELRGESDKSGEESDFEDLMEGSDDDQSVIDGDDSDDEEFLENSRNFGKKLSKPSKKKMKLDLENSSKKEKFKNPKTQMPESKYSKAKTKTKISKKRNKTKVTTADGDEFSQLLEEDVDFYDPLQSTSQALSRSAKTHMKQILWEKKRSSENSVNKLSKNKNFSSKKKIKSLNLNKSKISNSKKNKNFSSKNKIKKFSSKIKNRKGNKTK